MNRSHLIKTLGTDKLKLDYIEELEARNDELCKCLTDALAHQILKVRDKANDGEK